MKKTFVPGSETAVWTYESVWGGGLNVTVIETAGGAVALDGAVDFDDGILTGGVIDLSGVEFVDDEAFAEALAEAAGEGAISVEAEPMGAAAEYLSAVDCMDMRISAGWC